LLPNLIHLAPAERYDFVLESARFHIHFGQKGDKMTQNQRQHALGFTFFHFSCNDLMFSADYKWSNLRPSHAARPFTPINTMMNKAMDTKTESVRVAVVSPQVNERAVWQDLLAASPGFQCIGAYASAQDALKSLPITLCHLAVLDLPGLGPAALPSPHRTTDVLRTDRHEVCRYVLFSTGIMTMQLQKAKL
jgi:hypothetical protein